MKLTTAMLVSSSAFLVFAGCVTTVTPNEEPARPAPPSDASPSDNDAEVPSDREDVDAGTKLKDAGNDAGKGTDSGKGPPPPPPPPPSFTGIGRSFAACNGRGQVAHYGPSIPTKIIDVPTAWIFGTDNVSGRGNKVFGYSPGIIDHATFPLTGTVGGYQVKLAINAPQPTLVVGQQYGGTLALSTWNSSTRAWDQAIGSSTAVVISVLEFFVDSNAWSDGHWCAGRLAARVQSIVDGTGVNRLDFDFLCTSSHAKLPTVRRKHRYDAVGVALDRKNGALYVGVTSGDFESVWSGNATLRIGAEDGRVSNAELQGNRVPAPLCVVNGKLIIAEGEGFSGYDLTTPVRDQVWHTETGAYFNASFCQLNSLTAVALPNYIGSTDWARPTRRLTIDGSGVVAADQSKPTSPGSLSMPRPLWSSRGTVAGILHEPRTNVLYNATLSPLDGSIATQSPVGGGGTLIGWLDPEGVFQNVSGRSVTISVGPLDQPPRWVSSAYPYNADYPSSEFVGSGGAFSSLNYHGKGKPAVVAAAGNIVLVGLWGGQIVALDSNTGKELWTSMAMTHVNPRSGIWVLDIQIADNVAYVTGRITTQAYSSRPSRYYNSTSAFVSAIALE